jgi:hypothetical protein
MPPFGSHQAPLYRISRQLAKGYVGPASGPTPVVHRDQRTASAASVQLADFFSVDMRGLVHIRHLWSGGHPRRFKLVSLNRGRQISLIKQGTSFIRQGTSLIRQGNSLSNQGNSNSLIRPGISIIRHGTSLMRKGTLLIRQGTSLKKAGELPHKTTELAQKTTKLAHKNGHLAHKKRDLAH